MNTDIGAKRNTKRRFLKLQKRKLELLFIIMKRDTLLILRIRELKLLQKKSIPVGKADNVNRRDRDKKAQPKEHTYRWDVKLTPFGTPSLNLSKPDRHGG